jgi:hypothetical protein
MDIPRISTKYIRGIPMDIHGISFDIYTLYIRGISMGIPRFLNPDFSAGSCCCSLSMRTRLWVLKSVSFHGTLFFSPRQRRLALCCAAGRRVGDQECFIPRATMAIVPGEKAAHKGSLPPFPLRQHRCGRRRLALRCAAGRLSCCRLGSLVLAILPQ